MSHQSLTKEVRIQEELTDAAGRCGACGTFSPGQIVITATAQRELPQADVQRALARHLAGDWGDCGPDDWQENELSLVEGFRLFSVYHTAAGRKFWIITEADRSATTILMPEDY